MSYRGETKVIIKDAGWTFRNLIPLIIGILLFFSVLGFVLNSVGLLGRTIVEREIFEQSYQRSSAIQSQINKEKATIISIKSRLSDPALEESLKTNLQAQLRAAELRLNTAEMNQSE